MFRMNTSLEASSSASVEAEPLADGLREGAVRLIVCLIPAFVSSAVVSGSTADGAIGNVITRLNRLGINSNMTFVLCNYHIRCDQDRTM